MSFPYGSNAEPLRGVAGARGVALFFGAYAMVGLIVSLADRALDLNLWWIDLRLLPFTVATVVIAVFAIVMLAFGIRPFRNRYLRLVSAVVGLSVAAIACFNAITFWRLAFSGKVQPGCWIPISVIVAFLVGGVARAMLKSGADQATSPIWTGGVFLLCCCLFPVTQIVGFGRTNYSRPSDVAVVFGARVYVDGRLSDALEDRVLTAASLYRNGLVRKVVMSGGPGDGAIHEAEAMRRRAVELGVPHAAITVDYAGFNTAATVLNTAGMNQGGAQRLIAVSEFYHLPRIKLAYAAAGVDVITVPARARHWARNWPAKSILREVPAFWVYFARTAASSIRVYHA